RRPAARGAGALGTAVVRVARSVGHAVRRVDRARPRAPRLAAAGAVPLRRGALARLPRPGELGALLRQLPGGLPHSVRASVAERGARLRLLRDGASRLEQLAIGRRQRRRGLLRSARGLARRGARDRRLLLVAVPE